MLELWIVFKKSKAGRLIDKAEEKRRGNNHRMSVLFLHVRLLL